MVLSASDVSSYHGRTSTLLEEATQERSSTAESRLKQTLAVVEMAVGVEVLIATTASTPDSLHPRRRCRRERFQQLSPAYT